MAHRSIALLLVAATLTACTSDAEPGGGTGPIAGVPDPATDTCVEAGKETALAAGVRANNPTIGLPAPVTEIMTAAVDARQRVALIRLDGDPKIVFDKTFAPESLTDGGIEEERTTYLTDLNETLAGNGDPETDLRAQRQEADVLKALTLAAESVGDGGNVVLLDSGLQTLPPLDFISGSLLLVSPEALVEFLKEEKQLPDLANRNVYLGGIGSTAPPQEGLDNRLVEHMRTLWKTIALEAGASCVHVDRRRYTEDAPDVSVPVSPVTLPPPPRVPVGCEETSLGEQENVGFKVGEAVFRDRPAALKAIKGIADLMKEHDQSADLTGSTSSEGGTQANKDLSLLRAEAVKSELVGFGIPDGRIKTYGAGEKLPGRVDDMGPDGLILDRAVLNRKVVVKLTGEECPT